MSVMIDLNHLRTHHPVITVAEYLMLQGLDPEHETGNGAWDVNNYHNHTRITDTGQELDERDEEVVKPSIKVIPNDAFDPSGTIRVDRLPPNHLSSSTLTLRNGTLEYDVYQNISAKFNRWHTIDIDTVRQVLVDAGLDVWRNDHLGGINDELKVMEGAEERDERREKDLEEAEVILRRFGLGMVHTFTGL